MTLRNRLARAAGLLAVALLSAAAACGGDMEGAAAPPGTPPAEAPSAETAGGNGDDTGGGKRAEPAAAGGGSDLRLVTVERAFDMPVYVASTPSQKRRIYVVEQGGLIHIIQRGRRLPQPFLDIRRLTEASGEQGLLSMAFHPNYARNRLFYVNYTNNAGDTRVAEYRSRPGKSPVRRRVVLAVDQPYANHNGGQLQFGPDGMLYVGMGDGGSQGDPDGRAQNLGSRFGKILRQDVNARGGNWQVTGYGLRNPWRFSFDRDTGDLYIADVGGGQIEEVDFTPRQSQGLENYGWDVYEGSRRHEQKDPSGNGQLVFPIHEYDHDLGCSITGGYVYRGSSVPAAEGRYFFGDYCSGIIWSLRVANGKATDLRRHGFSVEPLSSFGEGPTGELFLVSHSGTIYRLARS